MKPEPGQKQYACPYCQTVYLHDRGYRHTVQECQQREREHGRKNAPVRN